MTVDFNGFLPLPGGACAAEGFSSAASFAEAREHSLPVRLGLVWSGHPCHAAVYTAGRQADSAAAALNEECRSILRGILIRNGSANTGQAGGIVQEHRFREQASGILGIPAKELLLAAVGRNSVPLDLEQLGEGLSRLEQARLLEGEGPRLADVLATFPTGQTEYAVSYLEGETIRKVGGCTGYGDLLGIDSAGAAGVITTDVPLSEELLKLALDTVAEKTFGRLAGEEERGFALFLLSPVEEGRIERLESPEYELFLNGLYAVSLNLARELIRRRERVPKLWECVVGGAPDDDTARRMALHLLSAEGLFPALTAEHTDWPAVLARAAGVKGWNHPEDVRVELYGRALGGTSADPERKKREILSGEEVSLIFRLEEGAGRAAAWGGTKVLDRP